MPAKPEYEWSATEPSPVLLNEFICSNSALWPQWDWRGLVEAGLQARKRFDPIEDAIERIRIEYNFPTNSHILVSAWIGAGLIAKVESA